MKGTLSTSRPSVSPLLSRSPSPSPMLVATPCPSSTLSSPSFMPQSNVVSSPFLSPVLQMQQMFQLQMSRTTAQPQSYSQALPIRQTSFPFPLQPSSQPFIMAPTIAPSTPTLQSQQQPQQQQSPISSQISSTSSPRSCSPRVASSVPSVPPLLPCSKDFSFRYRDAQQVDSLTCCVCLDVLSDDCVSHATCNTHFCKKCVNSVAVCPMCRGNFEPSPPSSHMLESLHAIPVVCPVPGCAGAPETQVTRGNLDVHILSSHLCEVLVSLQRQVDYLNSELRAARAESGSQQRTTAGKRSYTASPSPTLSPSCSAMSPNDASSTGLVVCGRCRRVYSEEDKQSCCFHPGAFAGQAGWTCCGSHDYSSPGCKAVRHVPVVEFSGGSFC